MKFYALRSEINRPISNVCSTAKSGKSDSVLSKILFDVVNGEVHITANDGSKQLSARIDISDLDSSEHCSFLVDAKKLQSIVKAAPEKASITFDYKKNDDCCVVRYGRSSFKLKAVCPEGEFVYPKMTCSDIRSGFFVKPDDLHRQLSSCDYAMGKDDVRHYLNGMYIELSDGVVSYAASNGHVLAKARQEVLSKGDKTAVILPHGSVRFIESLTSLMGDEPVKVLFNHVTMKIESGDYVFVGTLIDGQYPDVDRVIPQTVLNRAKFNTKNLLSSVSRVSVTGASGILLEFAKNLVTIKSDTSDNEESVEELDADYDGQAMSIKVSTDYLSRTLNALSNESDQVEVCFNDSNSAFLIEAFGIPAAIRTHVVMPMRM
ncbi:DNA polymerase III subunit beta [Endozoicomonas sp. ALC066]|uniref:DNA polymerase III subunit beta n=1 Tax=Endozoicomonas sp. ALC066 TaxID=3403078 RepID=UPI003BB5BC15